MCQALQWKKAKRLEGCCTCRTRPKERWTLPPEPLDFGENFQLGLHHINIQQRLVSVLQSRLFSEMETDYITIGRVKYATWNWCLWHKFLAQLEVKWAHQALYVTAACITSTVPHCIVLYLPWAEQVVSDCPWRGVSGWERERPAESNAFRQRWACSVGESVDLVGWEWSGIKRWSSAVELSQ